MPQPRVRELDLYEGVARWLSRTQRCFKTDVNKGLRVARIDAIGIRDVGGNLTGRCEVIAVEVKREGAPFGNALGQAHSYSVYADRCYLAYYLDSAVPTSDEAIEIASHLGVGLIQLSGPPKAPRFKVLLSAPTGLPLEHLRLELIDRLGHALCTVCGSLFEKKVVRGDSTRSGILQRAVEDEKGLVYWLDEAARHARVPRGEPHHRRRYICPDCLWAFFSDLV